MTNSYSCDVQTDGADSDFLSDHIFTHLGGKGRLGESDSTSHLLLDVVHMNLYQTSVNTGVHRFFRVGCNVW